MTHTPKVISVALICLPFLARAEGKCGDDPKRVGSDLVVTWTLPVPAGADITPGVDDEFFRTVDTTIGSDIPAGIPSKVTFELVTGAKHPVADGTFTPADPKQSRKTTVDDLAAWEDHYVIPLPPAVRKAIQEYLDDKTTLPGGFEMYASLVQHPSAQDDGLGYSFCTCALQRGVVMWEGGKERLYVRSSFHSEKHEFAFKNFRPRGVMVAFASQKIWFPLRLNRVLPDPTTPAFLVLDVLTPDSLREIPSAAIPDDLQPVARGRISLQDAATKRNKVWNYVRLRRKYQRTDNPASINDLALAPPPAK